MIIRLHPDLERFAREQVEQGAFASVDEVFTESLFLLWQHSQSRPASERQEPPHRRAA